MRVLICDDHRLFAEALAVVLGHRGHEVVGCVTTPDDALSAVLASPIDVCAMDLHFPDDSGVDGTSRLLEAAPSTRVVILTGSTDPGLLARALNAGALGMAMKDDDLGRVIDTIERVFAGEVVFQARILQSAKELTGGRPEKDFLASFLTPRELQVLQHLVQGESTATLALAMGVRYSTARTHIQNALTKLGVHSKLEAVAYAISNNLVSLPASPSDMSRTA